MWSLLVAAAFAEPPPPGGQPDPAPLALPAHAPPPPARHAPRIDDAYGRHLGEYREQRLRLRPYESLYYSTSGGYVGYGGYGGYGGWGIGMGFPTVWVDQVHRVAVYQGSSRLDVPHTLVALGEPERARGLERRIRTNRRWAGAATALGVTGLVGSVAGLVGSTQARDPYVRDLWNLEALASTVGMATGFVLAGFPGHRADRLTFDHAATFEPGELERAVDRHNAALAAELGLDPVDVGHLEE